jgi:ADP-ribose pyrophosphatase
LTRPHGFEIRDSSVIADVGFLSLEKRRVATPTGSRVDRFVVSHPGAVAIVPRRGDDVILIAQYRVAVDDVVLEIPAGKLDGADADHETAARRELAEETGLHGGHLEHLMDLVTSVGFSDEVISLYVADDLEPGDPEPAGAEEMAAEIVTMAWDDALAAIDSGSITDAKTVVGILLANRRGPA